MYQLAAIFVGLSAVMHGVAVALGQFATDVLPFSIFAILYLVFALCLAKKMRGVAWVTFMCMLIDTSAALVGINNGSYTPNWVFFSIAAFDIAATICLFAVLWKSKMNPKQSSAAIKARLQN